MYLYTYPPVLPYLSLIQPRDHNANTYTYVTPVYDATREERAASRSAFYYNVYVSRICYARGVLGLTKENIISIL